VPSTDVLIVGAGAAGLTAARLLTRAGRHVTILEARNRIGGRIHTLQDPLSPVPVELGAEFVHGKPPEIWTWIESGRLPAFELTGPHLYVRNGVVESWDSDETDRLLAGMAAAPEQSFRDYVERSGASAEARRSAVSFVEGFNAARQERISVASLAREEEASSRIDGDRSFRLAGGYSALIEALWHDIDPDRRRIHMATPVESVQWSQGEVRIVASNGRRFQAPRAIVTVPRGVLQAGPVRFDPEPPQLRAACNALEMGAAVRIVLRFRSPLWEDREPLRDAAFLHSDEPWMPTWWTALPARAPVIIGWSGGPRAEPAPADPAAWLPGALASLARILAMDADILADELETWHAHNWSTDPFACGAYSYAKVGGLPAQEHFGDPIEDTLYFAGEAANAEGHCGTVHGAISTATRAARHILDK
jgi:monoamine oxidase